MADPVCIVKRACRRVHGVKFVFGCRKAGRLVTQAVRFLRTVGADRAVPGRAVHNTSAQRTAARIQKIEQPFRSGFHLRVHGAFSAFPAASLSKYRRPLYRIF